MIAYKPQYANSWAVVVGINEYQSCSPLSYACNDADALSSALIGTLGFPSSNVFQLKNGAATKQAILDHYLGLTAQASNPDDRVLVFFAGHGFTAQGLRGPVGYLVPVDGSTDKLNSLIRWDELTRNTELIGAKHILFVIDACYSGLMIQRVSPPRTGRFVSDMLQRLSRQVITAGKADETVADGGSPASENSIFTGYLVEGLSGAASDETGVLTANMLMNYVYNKVGQDSRSRQTPHYGHIEGDGDFILKTPNNEHLTENDSRDYLVETVAEMPELFAVSSTSRVERHFAERIGYSDPNHPNFGRNPLSARLGEHAFKKDFSGADYSKAFSWMGLIIEPVALDGVTINLAEWLSLRPHERKSDQNPVEQFPLLVKAMTTIDSAILYKEEGDNNEYWANYLRVNKDGNIEYADSHFCFWGYDEFRCFGYVQLIGLTWQFLFLAKRILRDIGFAGGVRFLFNMVGVRGTLLSDFSIEPGADGRKWQQPFASTGVLRMSNQLLELKCQDSNLQMEYGVALDNLTEESSFKIVNDIGQKLALAYNLQSPPRCFNYNTEVFPWRQYLQSIRESGG